MNYLESIDNAEPCGMPSEQLNDIKEAIRLLTVIALDIIPDKNTQDRAYHYWFTHILGALDENGPFIGGSTIRMQDTIIELQEKEEIDALNASLGD